MKKVEILGANCARCKRLFEVTQRVVRERGLDAEVVKVEDIPEIVSRGVLMTPGFVVDGKVKSSGKVLSDAEIVKFISE